MNSLTLRAVSTLLAPHFGRRVDRAARVDDWEIQLGLEGEFRLVICIHPRQNTLFAAEGPDPGVGTDAPFARELNRSLVGSRFTGARQAGLDRVAALTFERRDRLGDVARSHLVVELTGSSANLIFAEGEDPFSARIRDRLRAPSGRDANRLAPGHDYTLPPDD
jgi:predicted ribosome quality control (RQC) complex YloA/Tae2 family protein